MTKINCITCGSEFEKQLLDSDGICETCNLEDYCPSCNRHELNCECGDFLYGFEENDFEENDGHDELEDWEGDDWDDDD